MKNRSLLLLFLAGLFLGLGAVIFGQFLLPRWLGPGIPVLEVIDSAGVGARGPLGLRFARPVDLETLQARLIFDPPVDGRLEQQGSTVTFFPQPAFQPGQEYRLTVGAGVAAQDGSRAPRGTQLRFRVRAPGYAYLSFETIGGRRDLWYAAGLDAAPVKLSGAAGSVESYAVFHSGDQAIFSAANERGGADLWLVDRAGAQDLLLDCGADICGEASPAPNSGQVAFSRVSNTSGNAGPVVWLLDLASRQAAPLSNDPLIAGELPAWSPDGSRLSYYDRRASAIRVRALADGREALIETNLASPGAWSPDGTRLVFAKESSSQGFTLMRIYEMDFRTQSIREILGENSPGDGSDFNLPAWSPDGEWLLFGQRVLPGNPGKQLWMIRPDGSQPHAVTEDHTRTFAAYSWSPDPHGQAILFQQYRFDASDNRPAVGMWTEQGGLRTLAEDAAMPQWWP